MVFTGGNGGGRDGITVSSLGRRVESSVGQREGTMSSAGRRVGTVSPPSVGRLGSGG